MAEMLSPRQRPLGISIIAIITAVQGIGDIIVSLIAFFVSNATTGFVGGIATAASSIFLIVGVLTLVLAWGLWTLKPWAFWTTVVLEALGFLGTLISMFASHGFNWSNFFHLLTAAIVLIYLFVDRNVRQAFHIGNLV